MMNITRIIIIHIKIQHSGYYVIDVDNNILQYFSTSLYIKSEFLLLK